MMEMNGRIFYTKKLYVAFAQSKSERRAHQAAQQKQSSQVIAEQQGFQTTMNQQHQPRGANNFMRQQVKHQSTNYVPSQTHTHSKPRRARAGPRDAGSFATLQTPQMPEGAGFSIMQPAPQIRVPKDAEIFITQQAPRMLSDVGISAIQPAPRIRTPRDAEIFATQQAPRMSSDVRISAMQPAPRIHTPRDAKIFATQQAPRMSSDTGISALQPAPRIRMSQSTLSRDSVPQQTLQTHHFMMHQRQLDQSTVQHNRQPDLRSYLNMTHQPSLSTG